MLYLHHLQSLAPNDRVELMSMIGTRSQSCYYSNQFFYWKVPDCHLEEIGSTYRVIGRVDPTSDDGLISKKRLMIEDIRYFENKGGSDHGWISVFVAESARWRSAIHRHVMAVMDAKPGGLVLSLVFGTQEYLDATIRRHFEITGTLHILAVSGLHVSLFMGVVQSSVAPFSSGKRRAALVWLISCAYVILVGFKPSILRAWGMMSVALVGRHWLSRQYSPPRALWLVVGALLLIRPDWLFHPGLQLSVAATAGIMTLASKLQGIGGVLAFFPDLHDSAHAVQVIARSSHSHWISKLIDTYKGSLAVSLAAQVATAPLVLLHFGSVPLLSFLPSSVATLLGGYLLTWLFLATPVLMLTAALPWLQSMIAILIEHSLVVFVNILEALTFSDWWLVSIDSST